MAKSKNHTVPLTCLAQLTAESQSNAQGAPKRYQESKDTPTTLPKRNRSQGIFPALLLTSILCFGHSPNGSSVVIIVGLFMEHKKL